MGYKMKQKKKRKENEAEKKWNKNKIHFEIIRMKLNEAFTATISVLYRWRRFEMVKWDESNCRMENAMEGKYETTLKD